MKSLFHKFLFSEQILNSVEIIFYLQNYLTEKIKIFDKMQEIVKFNVKLNRYRICFKYLKCKQIRT